jgi:anti-anti-sigma regulatory factor
LTERTSWRRSPPGWCTWPSTWPPTFIDSTGFGILVAAAKRLEAANGGLTLRNPGPQARQMLQLTGLDRFLAVEYTPSS